MNQLHIVTVGISLLTNYAKANNLPLENVLRHHRQLAEFIKADPCAACSEINSLDARTGLLRKKNKGLAVTLVYSATAGQESRLTARLIGYRPLRTTVRLNDPPLKLALTPGITGTTNREGGTENNAGAGLFFTKAIATVNRDFFLIYSGAALYKLLKSRATKNKSLHADPFADRHTALSNLPHWPGTVVGIDLTLDVNEAFSALLYRVRETYTEAMRERRKELSDLETANTGKPVRDSRDEADVVADCL